MKTFNVKNKWSALFGKGMMVLYLAFLLQAKLCTGGGVAGDTVKKTTDEDFTNMVWNIEDVSCWVDNKHRLMSYAAAKYGYSSKLQEIVKKFIQKKKEFGYNHKNEDFINAIDPSSQQTAIEAAIVEGHTDVVDALIKFTTDSFKQFINIDINRAGKGGTTLLVALKENQRKIVDILLPVPNLDIRTADPTSGNTPLHLAVKNKWEDIEKQLILKLKDQAPELLFAQNKDGDMVLHLAMRCKQKETQCVLIAEAKALALDAQYKDRIWIQNNKKESVVGEGINQNQYEAVKLIHCMPLEEIFKPNGKQETLLHRTVDPSKHPFFTALLYRIRELAKTDPSNVSKAVNKYFGLAQGNKSICKYILSKLARVNLVLDKQKQLYIKMFQEAIELTKSVLDQADWQNIKNAILDDIEHLEDRGMPKDTLKAKVQGAVQGILEGQLSPKHANQLRDIITTNQQDKRAANGA